MLLQIFKVLVWTHENSELSESFLGLWVFAKVVNFGGEEDRLEVGLA